MEINKLPNVKTHWIKDGYLTIQLNTGDYIRFNFNNIEALIEQCTISDVVGRSEQCDHDYSDGTGTGWNVCKKCGDMY